MVRKLTIEEFIDHTQERVATNDSINFIARARTPWNALSISAVTNNLYEQPRGIVGVEQYHPKGYFLSHEHFPDVNDKYLEIINLDDESNSSIIHSGYDGLKTLLGFIRAEWDFSTQNEISIIAPGGAYRDLVRVFANRKFASNVSPKFVSIDKALMSYTSSDEGKFATMGISLRSAYDLLMTIIEQQCLTSIQKQNYYLFDDIEGEITVNNNVRDMYRDVLPSGEVAQTGRALIITQPLSEIGYTSRKNEIKVQQEIISQLYSCGFSEIIICPHPRESQKKYQSLNQDNVSIADNSSAIEQKFLSLDPDIVVGATSTALLTASVLYDIPVYTYAEKIIEKNSIEKAEEFKNISQKYIMDFDEL
jgi:hypothetical protein